MKISFVKEGTLSPDGRFSQTSDKFLTGTKMQTVEFEEILKFCKNLPIANKKHVNGVIFPVIKDTLGEATLQYYNDLFYDGVVCVDIDHISKEIADTIFNGFDELFKYCNSLLSIQYSSSYYLKEDAGLHLYFYTLPGNGHDYAKRSRVCLALAAQLITKVLGINILELHNKSKESGDKVLDTSLCKIGQRFFLFHSDYKYLGEYCFPLSDATIDEVESKLKPIYTDIFTKSKIKENVEFVTEASGKLIGSVTNKIKLEYKLEFTIANTLASLKYSPTEITKILLSIDSRDRDVYLKKHGMSLESHLSQIARTSLSQTVSKDTFERAVKLLEGCGITLENGKIITTTKTDYREEISDLIDKSFKIETKLGMNKECVDYILSKRKAMVISECGSGKSYFIENIFVPKTTFCAWNSIRNGAFGEDSMEKTDNWARLVDQCWIDSFQNEKIAIDEIQMASSESDYRQDEVLGLERLLKSDNQILCFTGTASRALIKYFKGLGYEIVRVESPRKPITFKVWKTTSDKLTNAVNRFFNECKTFGWEASIYVSNECKKLQESSEYDYFCRSSFDANDYMKRLASDKGYFSGCMFSSKYIINGINNVLNKGKIRLLIRNDEFNWVEAEQLANRFRNAELVEVVIIATEEDYHIKQENYVSALQEVLFCEKISFFNNQLKNLFETIEMPLNQESASENKSKHINKGLRNYIGDTMIDVVYGTTEDIWNDRLINILEDFMNENYNQVFTMNNLTVVNQFNQAVKFSNRKSDAKKFRFYLDNTSKIEELLSGIAMVCKYQSISNWTKCKYDDTIEIDWDQIDTSISQTAFKDSDIVPFKLKKWIKSNLVNSGNDFIRNFIIVTKVRLYNVKKKFELGRGWINSHRELFEEGIDGIRLISEDDKIIFDTFYEENKDVIVTNHEWNVFEDYNINGKTIKLPYHENNKKGGRVGKALNYKYELIEDNSKKFKTQKECYEYAVANLNYSGKESGWAKQIKKYFNRL